jgi:CRP-like cAMP-binding protein
MAEPEADLASVTAFRDLGPGLLASLHASLEPFAARPGEMLFRQNDAAEGMHVIIAGRVRIQGRTLADGLTHLADIGAGEVVGEFGLVDQGRRSAGAEALEPTSGFFLPREQFERLLFVGDPAAQAVAREIRALACRRTRATLSAMAGEAMSPGERRASASAQRPQPRTAEGAADMLQALHQFRPFKPAEVAELMAAGQVLEAPRGARLAAEGDPADGLWIVIRGAVRTGLDRPGGVEQLLIHGPGKLVGGVAALDGAAQPAGLAVREAALLLRLPQAKIAAWAAQPASAAAKLVDLIAKQLVADLRALSRHQGRKRSMAALNAAVPGAAHV